MKTGELADAVWATWLKRRRLFLRHFTRIAKHFTRAGEIKTTTRTRLPQCSEHVMRAVNVHIHRREAVGKTLRHEALSREVITLVKVVLAQNLKDARVAFETGRVQGHAVENVGDAAEPRFRRFERDPAYQAVDFIAEPEQV